MAIAVADPARLTYRQRQVYDLDKLGMSPKYIAAETGMTKGRVANIKIRLKAMGFTVQKFRTGGEHDGPRNDNAEAVAKCKCGGPVPCMSCNTRFWAR